MLSSYLDSATIAALAAGEDDFEDGPSLKALQYRGVDVGYAALSSYAHVTRDPEPAASRPEIKGVLQRLVNTGKIVFEAYERALAEEKPDLVAVFNGRLAIDRPVLRACRAAGIDCHVYEISLGVDTIIRYENALPHDIACLRRQIDDLWSQAAADREAVGRSFYEIRRPSKKSGAASTIRINAPTFTDRQREGGCRRNGTTIARMSSSTGAPTTSTARFHPSGSSRSTRASSKRWTRCAGDSLVLTSTSSFACTRVCAAWNSRASSASRRWGTSTRT